MFISTQNVKDVANSFFNQTSCFLYLFGNFRCYAADKDTTLFVKTLLAFGLLPRPAVNDAFDDLISISAFRFNLVVTILKTLALIAELKEEKEGRRNFPPTYGMFGGGMRQDLCGQTIGWKTYTMRFKVSERHIIPLFLYVLNL